MGPTANETFTVGHPSNRRLSARELRLCAWFVLATLTAVFGHSASPNVSVAAAANLLYVLDALTAEFKRGAPAINVSVTTGASGSLFAQIKNGAPFDVFLSADTEYPRQIVAAGLGPRASLRTFATGRLVIWTMRAGLPLDDTAALLRSGTTKRIAIAQPKAAPYGRAAQTALEKLGVWQDVQPKLVFGESISQTAQFVDTGNADVGFVAMSLVLAPRLERRGQWREIPRDLYAAVSLDHSAVLTVRGAANSAAREFLAFLATEPARKILEQYGYDTPYTAGAPE